MLSKISLLLLALLSRLDVGAVDSLAFAERLVTSEVQAIELGEPVAAVQVELLPDPEGAEALAVELEQRLAERGSELEVFVEAVPGEVELPPSYRVGVGPFEAFEDAERAHQELASLGVDGFVRSVSEFAGYGC
jgi:hypothetical protein